MHEQLAATRAGLILALVYTVPLLLWLQAQATFSSAAQFDLALSMGGMMFALLVLQSLGIAVCLPWLMRFPGLADRCCALAMLILVPTPLYAVASLSGASMWTALMPATAALATLAVVLHGIYAAGLRLAPTGQPRALLLACMQLIIAGLCWHYRYLWQQVLPQ